jgi:hypothetical protein
LRKIAKNAFRIYCTPAVFISWISGYEIIWSNRRLSALRRDTLPPSAAYKLCPSETMVPTYQSVPHRNSKDSIIKFHTREYIPQASNKNLRIFIIFFSLSVLTACGYHQVNVICWLHCLSVHNRWTKASY